MEILVEFEVSIPDETPESEVNDRETAIGLYRADGEAQPEHLLGALPLAESMRITVTPLAPHPNEPALALAARSER